MNTTVTPQFREAAEYAIHLLYSASEQLRAMSEATEDLQDRVDLYGFALDAFMSTNHAWSVLSDEEGVELDVIEEPGPLALVGQAHDILIENTTVMDSPGILSLVLDVGTLRQQLSRYVTRH